MKLIISLLVYNQLEVTKQCIESLLENSTSDYLLIISDNASKKETADYLSKLKHPRIKYVRNEENLGFIKAHNKIFKETDSKYFCVLNNDIIIKTKGWDTEFINILEENPQIGQVGPEQEFGCLGMTGIGQNRFGRWLDYLSGHCFVISREAVNKSGGLFEDKYMKFAYSEDSDLSLRIRSKGYKIAEVKFVEVLHLHNQSFKNEKLDFDFRKLANENKNFLLDRWRKYLKTRNFEPLKILVKRDGAIGDVFCVSPIIEELKNKYPCSEIYVQTQCGAALLNNPYIVEIGKSMQHRYIYDMVIDLNMAYEENPLKHIVDAYAEKAKVILDDNKRIPKYYGIDKTENDFVLNDTIVVCSDGSWENRTWNKNRWKQFIEYLSKSFKIIEVGSVPSSYLNIGENLIGKTTLQQTINLIRKASLFVGFDSSLLHFAQSVGTPSFSIFGCICPNFRIHDWTNSRVVWLNQEQLNCAGCHHFGETKTYSECKRDKIYCLENIDLETVIDNWENGKYSCPTKPVKIIVPPPRKSNSYPKKF